MGHWNGISLLWNSRKQDPDIIVLSDASGSWGCGVCWGAQWLQLQWSPHLKDLSIAVKELIPVVLAAAMFGPQWSRKVIQFEVDNIAVVQVIEATYAQNAHLMHLIRVLVFYASYYNFWFTASHIPGVVNINADALSRNNMAMFFSQVPYASHSYPRPPSSTGIPQSNMDIHSLDDALQSYYSAALAKSTHKTYKAAERRYISFCENIGVNPLPANESTLCYFVTWLGQEGLQHSTICTYLSGVRQIHIAHGFPDLKFDNMPRLRQVLQGIKVVAGLKGHSKRVRLPITPSILRKVKQIWIDREDNFDRVMLWAAATTNFFTFCRSGEITISGEKTYDPHSDLSYGDISVDNSEDPSIVSLLIKHSKTDQAREGVKVYMGKTDDDICPVKALLHYLRLRGPRSGPLFTWKDGSPLQKPQFNKAVRTALTQAKLPADKFAGHSFRIGAATTAASAGLEDSTIQTLGRWKSSSYLLYVRLEPRHLAAVSSTLH